MKTRKILALLLVLVMMAGLLSTSAFATTYATGIAVYVYKGANDYTVYELGNLTSGDTALDAFIQADSTSAATYYTATGGSWLYTINGNLASYSAADYTVQNNDFLAFYLVPDYTEDTVIAPSYFTEWVIDGVIQSVTTTHLLGNDLGMETSLNYAHPTVNYISASSAYQAKSNNSPLTAIDGFLFISGSANDHNVLTTCYPVKNRSIDSTWIEVMRAKAVQLKAITDNISEDEIGNSAKTDLDSKAAEAVGARPTPPIMMGTFLNFEDAFSSLTYIVDARLDYAAFTGDLAVTSPFFPYYTAYTVQSSTADPTVVPDNFTMTITPKDSTAAVTVTGSTGVSISGTGNTRLVTLPDDTTSTITVTIKKVVIPPDPDDPDDPGVYITKTYTFSVTTPPAPVNNATVYAFLPAPGQFTNEGMGTGGWGDIYNAAGDLKMNEATGVSLGYFGGYVVYQFASSVSDSETNPYGADFIVYGNALWNNSEPGAIQVAQGVPVVENGVTTGYIPGDANSDGVVWYDIAGYEYYTSDTVKNYKLVFGNPNQESDPASSKANVPYDVYINNVKQASGGTVSVNSFHNHLWFPLYANYFANRTINSKSCPAIPKYASFDFADYDTTAATINGISCYRTMTLSGTKLSNVVTNNTAIYGFGYADVHPNVELGGTTAYNPYLTFSSSNDYATKTAGTSGGDPIDIAWAVYPKGTVIDNQDVSGLPAGLGSVQFVRIYTAAAQGNGVFGEVSTEVCGIAAVTSSGGTVGTTDAPTVYMTFTNPTMSFITTTISPTLPTTSGNAHSYIGTMRTSANNVSATTYDISVTATSGDNVFVNGSKLTETGSTGVFTGTFDVPAATDLIQLIVQSGTKAPYIVVLN